MRINLDDKVKVKLTSHGIAILERTLQTYPEADANGFTSFSMLDLLRIFGEHVMDNFKPFETSFQVITADSCAPKQIDAAPVSILKEADALVNAERPSQYGPVCASFDAAGRILDEMLTEDERRRIAAGSTIGSVIIKAQIALKLVRNSYSPKNRDHRVDVVGYTELLDQYVKARG